MLRRSRRRCAPRRTTHRSRAEQLTAPAPVTAAFAATTRAAVGIIVELNRQITDLEAELATHFEAHPDADIYLSLPVTSIAASVATSFATLPCAEFRTGLRLREAVRADLPTRRIPGGQCPFCSSVLNAIGGVRSWCHPRPEPQLTSNGSSRPLRCATATDRPGATVRSPG